MEKKKIMKQKKMEKEEKKDMFQCYILFAVRPADESAFIYSNVGTVEFTTALHRIPGKTRLADSPEATVFLAFTARPLCKTNNSVSIAATTLRAILYVLFE